MNNQFIIEDLDFSYPESIASKLARLLPEKIKKIAGIESEKQFRIKIKNLKIKKGFVSLLGRSGSGKSTLLSILSGLERIGQKSDEESITDKIQLYYCSLDKNISYIDQEFKKLSNKDFGFVFQRCYESKPLNVKENVLLPAYVNKKWSNELPEYVDNLIEAVHLGAKKHSPSHTLSGGELSRVSGLRGIVKARKVLFVDEPTSSLDSKNAELMMRLINQWKDESEGTVVLVTHDLEQVWKSDQIIILESHESRDKKTTEVIWQGIRPNNGWGNKDKEEIKKRIDPEDKEVKKLPQKPDSQPIRRFWKYRQFLAVSATKNLLSRSDGSFAFSIITGFALFCIFTILNSGYLLLGSLDQLDFILEKNDHVRKIDIFQNDDLAASNIIRSFNQSRKDVDENLTKKALGKWFDDKIIEKLEDLENQFSELNYLKSIIDFSKQTNKIPSKDENQVEIDLTQLKAKINGLINSSKNNESLKGLGLKTTKRPEKLYYELNEIVQFIDLRISINQTSNTTYDLWKSIKNIIFTPKEDEVSSQDGLAKAYSHIDYFKPFAMKQKEGKFWNREGNFSSIRGVHFEDRYLYRDDLDFLIIYDNYGNNAISQGIRQFQYSSNMDEGIIITEKKLKQLGYNLGDKYIYLYYDRYRAACVPIKAIVRSFPAESFVGVTTLGYYDRLDKELVDQVCTSGSKEPDATLEWDSSFDMSTFKKQLIDNYKTYKELNSESRDHVIQLQEIAPNEMLMTINPLEVRYSTNQWFDYLTKELSMTLPKEIRLTVGQKPASIHAEMPACYNYSIYPNTKGLILPILKWLQESYDEDELFIENNIEAKIIFADQMNNIKAVIAKWGIGICMVILAVFLAYYLIIITRIKATEIAVFRANGGSIFGGVGIIFSMQMVMLLLTSILTSLMLTLVLKGWLTDIFKQELIYDTFVKIGDSSMLSSFEPLGIPSIIFFNFCCFVGAVLISIVILLLMMAYVKRYHHVSAILKER